MRQYELTYLISDDAQESEITKITGTIGGIVAKEKGKILKEESLGRRKLAYPINKQLFATYITTNFELKPQNLKNIEKELRHDNAVVRYLLTVKDFGKEKLSLSAEDIAAAADIEQVVGGEKSFEAIEGKTDESMDLMSKRAGVFDDDDKTAETPRTKSQSENIEKKSKDLTPIQEVKEQIIKKVEKKEDKKPEIIKEVPVSAVKSVAKKAKEEKPEKIEKKPTVKKAQPKIDKSPAKKIEKEEKIIPVAEKEEIKAQKLKKKAIKKDSTVSDEADRLAKLDQELNDILGEEL